MPVIDLSENEVLKELQEDCLDRNINIVLDNILSEYQRLNSLFLDIDPIITEQEKSAVKEIIKVLKNDFEDKDDESEKTIQKLVEFIYNYKTHKILGKSKIEKDAFFVYIFSAFDGFLRSILRCCYFMKPELTQGLTRQISITEINKHDTVSSLIQNIIDDDISDIIRESYLEQFTILEKKFDIKLRDFPEWPQFVEMSQRRNLIVHCDGNVSNQYLQNCIKNGVD